MAKQALTEKQKKFIDFYIQTGNASEAARQAGYAEKTAPFIGAENLQKPHITRNSIFRQFDRIMYHTMKFRSINFPYYN